MKTGWFVLGTLLLQVHSAPVALANAENAENAENAAPLPVVESVEGSRKGRKGGSGKGPGSSRAKSHLDGFSPEALSKVAELEKPVEVEILSRGRSVEGLEDIKERIVDVKITNPNSYAILFRGRQYKDNKTISPIWRALGKEGWAVVGWDWCGRGVRDWEIEPRGSMKISCSTCIPS